MDYSLLHIYFLSDEEVPGGFEPPYTVLQTAD